MPPELINQVQSGILFAAQGRMTQLSLAVGMENGQPITVRLVFLPDDLGKMRMMEQRAFAAAKENAEIVAEKKLEAVPAAAEPEEPAVCGAPV